MCPNKGSNSTNDVSLIKSAECFKIDHVKKTIVLQKGKWKINKDIIVPEGYLLSNKGKATIDLVNEARFIVKSSVSFKADDNTSLTIKSSDSSSLGVHFFINKQDHVILRNVVFQNVECSLNGFESLSKNTHHFYLSNCFFNAENDLYDLLTLTNGNALIANSSFNGGNSGIVVLNSFLNIENVDILNSKKGLIGEFTVLNGLNFNVKKIKETGIILKNKSQVFCKKLSVVKCSTGFELEGSNFEVKFLCIEDCDKGMYSSKLSDKSRINIDYLSSKKVKELVDLSSCFYSIDGVPKVFL